MKGTRQCCSGGAESSSVIHLWWITLMVLERIGTVEDLDITAMSTRESQMPRKHPCHRYSSCACKRVWLLGIRYFVRCPNQ